jgi:hypothetical protein
MGQGQFENQRALIEYAKAYDLSYSREGSPTFVKRRRLAQLAQPGQYELVEVLATKRGITKALLFPRAILQAEAEAERPFREAEAIKRRRPAAKRAAKRDT